MESALKNPLGEEAKYVMAQINPIMRGLGSNIPHSPAERAMVVSEMIGMAHRFGNPSLFFTFAPDDCANVVMIRLTFPVRNPLDFPATSVIKYRSG
jgi:hypothetical protein